MISIHARLGIIALTLSLAGALPAQSPADAAIDKAVAAYKGMKSAKASFEQTITNPLTGSSVSSKGEFEQRQPGTFVFRFTEPKGDMIVGDGKTLWVFLPSTNPGQVIRSPLDKSGAGSLDLTGQFFNAPRTRYTIADAGTATVSGQQTRALKLEPKHDGEPFAHATVWVDTDDGTLRQFETIDGSGVKRLVRVTTFQPNVPVSAEAVRFSPPKGVRIVDQEALRR